MKNCYFAGGCFWCISPFFQMTEGVKRVECGYSGGDEPEPRYEDVKLQKTGHRETIMIEYDPDMVSFSELLDVFLGGVDPFDGGGQFIDRGRSYTLAVYHTCPEERAETEKKIAELERDSGKKVFIALEPFKSFWPAEERHQDYWRKEPGEFEKEIISSGRRKEKYDAL